MKTRKAMLILAVCMIILYTVADAGITFIGASLGYSLALDSVLTEKWYDFWQWVVTTGAAITVAKTVKGRTNSDSTEDIPFADTPAEELPPEDTEEENNGV